MGDQAFYGGGFGETWNNVFQTVGIETPASNVLGTCGIATLDNLHLRPFAGEHQCGNRTGKPSTDDDGVKDIFGHKSSLSAAGP